jgi:hypothetical protein
MKPVRHDIIRFNPWVVVAGRCRSMLYLRGRHSTYNLVDSSGLCHVPGAGCLDFSHLERLLHSVPAATQLDILLDADLSRLERITTPFRAGWSCERTDTALEISISSILDRHDFQLSCQTDSLTQVVSLASAAACRVRNVTLYPPSPSFRYLVAIDVLGEKGSSSGFGEPSINYAYELPRFLKGSEHQTRTRRDVVDAAHALTELPWSAVGAEASDAVTLSNLVRRSSDEVPSASTADPDLLVRPEPDAMAHDPVHGIFVMVDSGLAAAAAAAYAIATDHASNVRVFEFGAFRSKLRSSFRRLHDGAVAIDLSTVPLRKEDAAAVALRFRDLIAAADPDPCVFLLGNELVDDGSALEDLLGMVDSTLAIHVFASSVRDLRRADQWLQALQRTATELRLSFVRATHELGDLVPYGHLPLREFAPLSSQARQSLLLDPGRPPAGIVLEVMKPVVERAGTDLHPQA